MAISGFAARGSAGTGTSGTTITHTPGATVAVGKYLFTIVTTFDNVAVQSIVDDVGNTWTFVDRAENLTNANAYCELWMCLVANQLVSSTVITVTFASTLTDRCVASGEFTFSGGAPTQSAAQVENETNGVNGYGSVSHSSLPSKERLYLRCMAKRGNTTTANTGSTNFTDWGLTVRSRNSAQAIIVRVEHRINTSTGETSNPTLANTGNTANMFFAFEEAAAGGGGDTGADYPYRSYGSYAHQ